MSWQLFTIISVLSLSISVILQRILIHKDKTDPFAYAVLFQGIVGVLLTAFALVYGFSLPNLHTVWLPALVSVVFYGVGHIVYAKTLQKVEASAFSVLFATQAIWIMMLGVFLLSETMTYLQVIGTMLIFGSIGVVAKNFYSIFRDKGTLLGLLTGLLFGIAIYTWSVVGRTTEVVSWAAVSFIGTALVAYLVRPGSVRHMKPLLRPRVLSKLVLLGIFYGVGSLAMLFAYKYGTFVVVSPLRQASIIVTVLFALTLMPQERHRIRQKISAALLCTIGVILLII